MRVKHITGDFDGFFEKAMIFNPFLTFLVSHRYNFLKIFSSYCLEVV